MSQPIQNRYEFVILFDVVNGNPNGDPDAGNMPRIDAETGHGIVTDVCLKRKIRNYVETVKEGCPGYKIYIRQGDTLNITDNQAFQDIGIDKSKISGMKRSEKNDLDVTIRNYMCSNFFDIRTFGAVMTTFVKAALNCGQVRGPVQLGFARSIDPIVQKEVSITRLVCATEEEAKKNNNTMGQKFIVPYGLYRAEGYVSANLAQRVTGFSEDDLRLLWDAILNMFELDRSAARGNMACRELIVFKHESALGNAPAYKLFEAVNVTRMDGVTAPRSYSDYTVSIDEGAIPKGVSYEKMG